MSYVFVDMIDNNNNKKITEIRGYQKFIKVKIILPKPTLKGQNNFYSSSVHRKRLSQSVFLDM